MSHPADNAFAASTCSLSLSVIKSSYSTARDRTTSIESLIWSSFAKIWPITKRKHSKNVVYNVIYVYMYVFTDYTYQYLLIRSTCTNSENTVKFYFFELSQLEVPAILNEDWIPKWIYPGLCFQSFTISYFELGYLEFPAISNSSFFSCTLNQPRHFELVKNRVQEETPKRLTKSEVHQVIKTFSRHSLFAVEGAKTRGQTSQLSITIDKSIRKNQKQLWSGTFNERFFNATASVDLSNINCIFI